MLTATDVARSNAADYLSIRSPLSSSAWSSAASCQSIRAVRSAASRDLRGDVAVGVHGQRARAVAEDFHDDPGRDALGKQQACRGMTQIVQPEMSRTFLCAGRPNTGRAGARSG